MVSTKRHAAIMNVIFTEMSFRIYRRIEGGSRRIDRVINTFMLYVIRMLCQIRSKPCPNLATYMD